MNKRLVHGIRKRSWWDGSVTAWCGDHAKAGTYTETWFSGSVNCPDCLAKMRKK